MGRQRWTSGMSLAVLVAASVVAVLLYRKAAASGTVADFFRIRRATYSLLQERIAAPLEGVRIPDLMEESPNPFPGESHIQVVVQSMDWSNTCSFQFRVELDDSALPPGRQGNSETMAAAVLVDHYFSQLENAGFRRVGSGASIGGMVQSARKMWISDEARSVVVEGTAFVSLESKEAIVQGVIHERLRQQ
jgi:hypothetical protein